MMWGRLMRLETICRMLTIALWVGGMVGLGLYIIWAMESPKRYVTRTAVNLISEAIIEFETWDVGDALSSYKMGQTARDLYRQDVRHWVAWYYSPLNIYYWGVALLFFSPAVGMQLLSHFLSRRS